MFNAYLKPIRDQIPDDLSGTNLSRCADSPSDLGVAFILNENVKLPHVPCFTRGTPWEICPPPVELGFEISHDGVLEIYEDFPADPPPVYARIKIDSFAELHESVEAFLRPHRPLASGPEFAPTRLNVLVEEIFYVVPIRGEARLVSVPDALSLFPDFDVRSHTLEALAGRKSHAKQNGDYDDSWFFICNSVDSSDPRFIPVVLRDLFIIGTEYLCPAAACPRARLGATFGVALRTTNRASILYLLDMLNFSIEGAQLKDELAASKSWKEWLKTKEIRAPRTRDLQIHYSLAFRNSRQSYLDEVSTLSSSRDPLEEALGLYTKRREMVRSIHSEMLLQIESLIQPLPFFIEYPYAQFVGTADRGQRMRHAQIILNVLCKMLVMLPLEEIQHQGKFPDAIENLASELYGPPLSDGAYLNHYRKLRKILASDPQTPKLQLFDTLVGTKGDDLLKYLEPLITVRNRAHHPPYDERNFVSAVGLSLPAVIGLLRDAFRHLEMIIPQQIQPTRHGVIVTAVKLMGENLSFRSVQLKTALPAGNFIVDELAAYRTTPSEILVPLNRWFQAKTFNAETFDVGVFDRMDGNQPTFSYIAH